MEILLIFVLILIIWVLISFILKTETEICYRKIKVKKEEYLIPIYLFEIYDYQRNGEKYPIDSFKDRESKVRASTRALQYCAAEQRKSKHSKSKS